MRGLVRNHSLIRSLFKPAAAAMATATIGLNLLVFDKVCGVHQIFINGNTANIVKVSLSNGDAVDF